MIAMNLFTILSFDGFTCLYPLYAIANTIVEIKRIPAGRELYVK